MSVADSRQEVHDDYTLHGGADTDLEAQVRADPVDPLGPFWE